MGTSVSTNRTGIAVELSNQPTDDFFYWAGELVEGTIMFTNTRHYTDLKLMGGYIELIGELVYMTTSNVTKRASPISHYAPFFTARHNFLSSLAQADQNITLHPGVLYTWPFNLRLAPSLPPSLPATVCKSPYIHYFIRVVLQPISWYRSAIYHLIPLTVYPRIDILRNLEQPLELVHENRKDVHLHVFVHQSGVLPGTRLPIKYDLHNPNRTIVERITVKLIQHRYMPYVDTIGFPKKTVYRMDVPDLRRFQGEHLHDTFEFMIPATRLPPTSSYTPVKSKFFKQSQPISISYELEMSVKLHGLFTNFSLSFPIKVGTEVRQETTYHDDDDQTPLPPPYESLINLGEE